MEEHKKEEEEPTIFNQPKIKKLPQVGKPMPQETPPLVQNDNLVPKKKSVFILWLLSTITFGIYQAIWYLKRVPEFYNLETRKQLKKKIPLTLLIVDISIIAVLIITPLTISLTDMGNFGQRISTLQLILFTLLIICALLRLFFTIYIAFVSRTIINQALEQKEISIKISGLFTLIFNFLYLQYEINRIIQDREQEPRKGPWIFLSIYILLIVLGIISNFI